MFSMLCFEKIVLFLLTCVTGRLFEALFLLDLKLQIRISLMPLRKFLDNIAYSKGFTPKQKATSFYAFINHFFMYITRVEVGREERQRSEQSR
jgi:hypothetical protein